MSSQRAGRMAWNRVVQAGKDPAASLNGDGARRQLTAFANFMTSELAHNGSFHRLHELQLPVMIVLGK